MMFKARQKGGGKNFLKLKDKDSVTGVFRGDPHTFYQHWVGGRGVTCTRSTGCTHCESGEKGSFRCRVNFIMSEEGKLIAKVFECGGKVYDALSALSADCDLSTHKVKITRSGSGTDTTYSILPVMKDGVLTKDALKAVEAVDLNALENETVEEGEDDAA